MKLKPLIENNDREFSDCIEDSKDKLALFLDFIDRMSIASQEIIIDEILSNNEKLKICLSLNSPIRLIEKFKGTKISKDTINSLSDLEQIRVAYALGKRMELNKKVKEINISTKNPPEILDKAEYYKSKSHYINKPWYIPKSFALKKSINKLENLLKRNPIDEIKYDTLNSLEFCYLEKNMYEKSINISKQILDSDVSKEIKDSSLFNTAKSALKQGDISKSRDIFMNLVNSDNTSQHLRTLSYYHLGICLIKLKDMKNAEHCFSEIIKINSDIEITENAKKLFDLCSTHEFNLKNDPNYKYIFENLNVYNLKKD